MNDALKFRFKFKKTGSAKYLSHLDLMRTFQRAFIRAGIPVKHTEGFNPHPHISIVLPLQLGVESVCERLDAVIEEACPNMEDTLNGTLPEGLAVTEAAGQIMKPGDIGFARYAVELSYDGAADTAEKAARLEAFLRSGPIAISKKTKRGLAELDIRPHVTDAAIEAKTFLVRLTALFSASGPTVNPSDLISALQEREELRPDFAKCTRLEIYNKNKEPFI
jgi:radical SAM-linked protein